MKNRQNTGEQKFSNIRCNGPRSKVALLVQWVSCEPWSVFPLVQGGVGRIVEVSASSFAHLSITSSFLSVSRTLMLYWTQPLTQCRDPLIDGWDCCEAGLWAAVDSGILRSGLFTPWQENRWLRGSDPRTDIIETFTVAPAPVGSRVSIIPQWSMVLTLIDTGFSRREQCERIQSLPRLTHSCCLCMKRKWSVQMRI